MTEMRVDSEQQLKALANDTRARILTILEDGPASAKELCGMLAMSHGKIGHHLKVLWEAGLIEVVETKQVRAMTELFYGLTYDRLSMDDRAGDRLKFTLAQASREAAPSTDQPFDPVAFYLTVRTDVSQAERLHERLLELAEEFKTDSDSDSSAVYGFTAAVFLTDTPQRRR